MVDHPRYSVDANPIAAKPCTMELAGSFNKENAVVSSAAGPYRAKIASVACQYVQGSSRTQAQRSARNVSVGSFA